MEYQHQSSTSIYIAIYPTLYCFYNVDTTCAYVDVPRRLKAHNILKNISIGSRSMKY